MNSSKTNLMRLAMEEAGGSLRRFGVSYTEAVDVFKIIHEAGIELLFRPLGGRADGSYLPPSTQTKAGVLLNSRRPLSRKRYTAAHELCHFLRRDTAKVRIETMSEECGLLGQGSSEEESLADFFAGHFLMPPKLVTFFFRKLGLKKESLGPADVYRLSLCMGTSYRATSCQLANLEFISRDHLEKVLETEPRQIKAKWVKSPGYRDIWPIDHKMSGLVIFPQVEDLIRVTLPETPSTGYVWHFMEDRVPVAKLESSLLRFFGPREHVGQSGEREMLFKVQTPGRCVIKIGLRRPWEKSEPSVEVLNLELVSTEREFNGHYATQLLPVAA